MPKVLTIGRTTVSADQRDAFLARVAARKAHYSAHDVRYWVFEEASLPGAFVEFCEANDAATLSKAHAATTDAPSGALRQYLEVGVR
jgi:hypothetical protein